MDDDDSSHMDTPVKSKGARIHWTESMEEALLTGLLEEMRKGNRTASGFEKEAYRAVLPLINAKCVQEDAKVNQQKAKNKISDYKKLYTIWKSLIELPGWEIDPETRRFTASAIDWEVQISAQKETRYFRTKPLPYEKILVEMFGGGTTDFDFVTAQGIHIPHRDLGTGEYAFSIDQLIEMNGKNTTTRGTRTTRRTATTRATAPQVTIPQAATPQTAVPRFIASQPISTQDTPPTPLTQAASFPQGTNSPQGLSASPNSSFARPSNNATSEQPRNNVISASMLVRQQETIQAGMIQQAEILRELRERENRLRDTAGVEAAATRILVEQYSERDETWLLRALDVFLREGNASIFVALPKGSLRDKWLDRKMG